MLNWRTKRHKEKWYAGPEEGRIVHYAKFNHVEYTIRAGWTNPWKREGPVVWHINIVATHGVHNLTSHTLAGAKSYCERYAETLE